MSQKIGNLQQTVPGYDDTQAGDLFQDDGHQQQARGGYNNFLSRFDRRPNVVAASYGSALLCSYRKNPLILLNHRITESNVLINLQVGHV